MCFMLFRFPDAATELVEMMQPFLADIHPYNRVRLCQTLMHPSNSLRTPYSLSQLVAMGE